MNLLKKAFKKKANTETSNNSVKTKNSYKKDPAEAILDELAKGVKNPNEMIKKELLILFQKVSKNPKQDLKSVLNDVKVLLSEYLKTAEKPNLDLVDQLMTLLVIPITEANVKEKQEKTDKKMQELGVLKKEDSVSEKESTSKSLDNLNEGSASKGENKGETNSKVEVKEEKSKVKSESESESESEKQVDENPTEESKVAIETGVKTGVETESEEQSQVKKQESTESQEAMIGLMMDELKEILAITTKASAEFKSNESKLQTSFDALKEEQNALKSEVGVIKEEIKSLEGNIEKFIGLYEVVSNMYNPFVDEKDTFGGSDQKSSSEPKLHEADSNDENVFDKEFDSQKDASKKDLSK